MTTKVHADAAGVLFCHTDTYGTWYLLTQRAKFLSYANTWTTPGGSVDEGETALEAAVRELHEELGVAQSQVRGTIRTVVERHGDGRLYTTFVVETDSIDVQVPEHLPRETAAVQWFLPEQIEALSLHPGFREIWAKIKETI